jgi:DNA-binding beta-propeller fold protein YncE
MAAALTTIVIVAAIAVSALRGPQRFAVSALDGLLPVAAVYDASRGRLYVAARSELDGGSSVVAAIEVQTGRSAYVAEVPATVSALTADGQRLLVASASRALSGGPGHLTVLEESTGRVTYQVPTAVNPIAALRGFADEILVLGQGTPTTAGSVHILDARGQALATVSVGTYPSAVVVNAQHDHAFVANQLGNSISVIDLSAHRVTRSVMLGPAPGTLAQLALDEDANALVAMSYPPRVSRDQPTEGLVQVIDADSLAQRASTTLSKPAMMKMVGRGGAAVVLGATDQATLVLALSIPGATVTWSREYAERIDALVTGSSRFVYLLNARARTVTVLDATTGEVACSHTLQGTPLLLAPDDSTGVFVIASGGEVVVVSC